MPESFLCSLQLNHISFSLYKHSKLNLIFSISTSCIHFSIQASLYNFILCFHRCGKQGVSDSYYLGWVDFKNVTADALDPPPLLTEIVRLDAQNFCAMVGYGFVFLQLVLIVTILAGERAPVQVHIYILTTEGHLEREGKYSFQQQQMKRILWKANWTISFLIKLT